MPQLFDIDDFVEPRWQRWTAIVLLVVSLALLVLAINLPGPVHAESGAHIQRVVVVHFDTTRMDDLGCYGSVARTPNVDAVAARGMKMTTSITPTPKTSPSIACFLTGRLPNRHGVYDVGAKLANEFTTLPEILRSHGFITGGFTSNLSIDRLRDDYGLSAGFDQGFDEWVGLRDLPAEVESNNAASRAVCVPLIDRALEFVDRHEGERFFLWMLHLDPHAPYAPPPPFEELYLDDERVTSADVVLAPGQLHAQVAVPGRMNSSEYVARHLAEVSLTDHHLGRLLRRLDELPGRTLLIVTSDHGESLGDADYWFQHGANIRHPGMNVPLIVACDDRVPVGESDALVSSIDLAPTILELLEIDGADLEADGRSFVEAFGGDDPWPERMIPVQTYTGSRWRGVRSREFSLQSQMDPRSGDRIDTLLYHLPTDPTESRNVADAHPNVLQHHLELETMWFSRGLRAEERLHDLPEMERILRSLGYAR